MENQSAAATALCRAGCGFFGSSSTDGLCSKCFKDNINKKQDTGRVSPPSSITSYVQSHDLKEVIADVAVDAVSSSLSSSSSSASLAIETAAMSDTGSTASTSDAAAPMSKSKPNRCAVCKKRVGLTGFVCRCSGLYCAEHRYDTAHDCQFDYKTVERDLIKKNNPVVMSEKIQRI